MPIESKEEKIKLSPTMKEVIEKMRKGGEIGFGVTTQVVKLLYDGHVTVLNGNTFNALYSRKIIIWDGGNKYTLTELGKTIKL